jgi:hypothetical protein
MDEKEIQKETIESKINSIKKQYEKKNEPQKELKHRVTIVQQNIADKVDVFNRRQSILIF